MTTSQCCCSRGVAKYQLEKAQLHLSVENVAQHELQQPQGILVAMDTDAGVKLVSAPTWSWEISQCALRSRNISRTK